MTSPSLRPSSSISRSGSLAKPLPLSAGGRLATCTLRDVTRSIVSASGIYSPDPLFHAGYATAAEQRGFNCRSIFDRCRDFANERPGHKAAAVRCKLVDDAGNHDRLIFVETLKPTVDDFWRVHRNFVEQPIAAETRDIAEFGSRWTRAKAGDVHAVWLQFLMKC